MVNGSLDVTRDDHDDRHDACPGIHEIGQNGIVFRDYYIQIVARHFTKKVSKKGFCPIMSN